MAWQRPETAWTAGRHDLRISPNGAVAARWSQMGWEDRGFVRLTDGEQLAPMEQDWTGSLDDGWHRRARVDQRTVRVETVLSGLTLLEIEVPTPEGIDPTQGDVRLASLSPAGDVVVALGCWYSEGGYVSHVAAWSVDAGELLVDVPVAVGCDWFPAPSALLTPNSRYAVLADVMTPTLIVVDLQDGSVSSRTLAGASEPEEPTWPQVPGILSAAVSPDGSQIAFADQLGDVRVWTLDGLEDVAGPFAAGFTGIDHDSYMPSVAGPVTWSPDGLLIAHIEAMGSNSIVVRRVADGEVVSTLEGVEPEEDESNRWLPPVNGAIALAFLRDGSGLVVSYDIGMSLYRCDDAAWPEPGPDLHATIEGPTQLTVGLAATFTATHLGHDHVHSHAFFVNGEPLGLPTLGRTATWTPESAGTYELLVVLDDGLSTGSAAMTVVVGE